MNNLYQNTRNNQLHCKFDILNQKDKARKLDMVNNIMRYIGKYLQYTHHKLYWKYTMYSNSGNFDKY